MGFLDLLRNWSDFSEEIRDCETIVGECELQLIPFHGADEQKLELSRELSDGDAKISAVVSKDNSVAFTVEVAKLGQVTIHSEDGLVSEGSFEYELSDTNHGTRRLALGLAPNSQVSVGFKSGPATTKLVTDLENGTTKTDLTFRFPLLPKFFGERNQKVGTVGLSNVVGTNKWKAVASYACERCALCFGKTFGELGEDEKECSAMLRVQGWFPGVNWSLSTAVEKSGSEAFASAAAHFVHPRFLFPLCWGLGWNTKKDFGARVGVELLDWKVFLGIHKPFQQSVLWGLAIEL